MKRTKQLQHVVDRVNEYLRNNHIKDESNDVFCVMQWALLDSGLYQGYNHFKEKELTDLDGSTIKLSVCAGTDDPEKFDYLQLY